MAVTTAIRHWSQALISSLTKAGSGLIDWLPGLIVAVLAVVVAWVVGRILERLVVLGLEAANFDELLARGPVNHNALESAGVKVPPSRLTGTLIFWVVFFFLGLAPAADAIGLARGRVFVERVIAFIPAVFVALAVIAAAFFIADLLREVIRSTLTTANLPFGRELGWFSYLVMVIFGLGLALQALSVPSPVITAGLALAAVAVGLCLAIGFGLGSRDVFGAITAGRDLRARLAEGDEVVVDDYAGTIERLGLDAVDLRTSHGLVSIPNQVFIQQVVEKKSTGRRAA